MQRPTASRGSASSWDKKDSTLSSTSSTKRSISAWTRSLSSHCQRIREFFRIEHKFCSQKLGSGNRSHQLIRWWSKGTGVIRSKHHHRLWRATTVRHIRHRHYITRCMCRGRRWSWTRRRASCVCSSWAISRAWRWYRLLPFSSLVFRGLELRDIPC